MNRRLSVVVFAALLVPAGCGSSGVDVVVPVIDSTTTPVPTMRVTDDDVVGLWGFAPETGGEKGPPWIRLDHDGRFGGFDGCNQVGGRWTLDEATGVVEAEVQATTEVACPAGAHVLLDELEVTDAGLSYRRGDGRTGLMPASDRGLTSGLDLRRADRVPAVTGE